MNCYKFKRVDPDWCEKRDVHPAVGAAIHAVAGDRREPHSIWRDPTAEELNHIKQAVQEFICRGLVEPARQGKYVWGTDVIVIEEPRLRACA